MSRYVQIRKMEDLTGYSESAIRTKIAKGIWLEGIHYRRAPDNRVLMDLEAYEDWVEGKHTFQAINQLLATQS